MSGPRPGRRLGVAVASLVAIAVAGCTGDGVIDLLPETVPAAPSASASSSCPPMPPGPHPGPAASAPAMMPGKPKPSPDPPCDSGPCPPTMPACDQDASVSLVDSEAVTP